MLPLSANEERYESQHESLAMQLAMPLLARGVQPIPKCCCTPRHQCMQCLLHGRCPVALGPVAAQLGEVKELRD